MIQTGQPGGNSGNVEGSGLLRVVLSQDPGRDPARVGLEQALVAHLERRTGLELVLIPPLVDLPAQHPALDVLRGEGDIVIVSWLFPRAAYWLLQAAGVKGTNTEIGSPKAEANGSDKAAGQPGPSERRLLCLQLCEDVPLERLVEPVLSLASNGVPSRPVTALTRKSPNGFGEPPRPRRWFPVIDYGRCTHCMECLDFCLFGVYDTDAGDRIVVAHPDSCKRGCPACSRVCPAQAIIFPDHKNPAIAGSDEGTIPTLKLDLSQLFGGPQARDLALRERQDASKPAVQPMDAPAIPPDPLDQLMDAVDRLDL